MSKKRTAILFGAGAVIPWDGPQTSSLTDLIINSSPQFICNDGKTKITQHIFNTLKDNEFTDDDINFETIISVIEELIIHYAYFDGEKELPSLNKIFFSSKFEEIILNFSIKGGIKKHGYQLEIPKGREYNYSKSALNKESPEQFYFQHLLSELITNINGRISKYSYHTAGNSVIDKPDKQPLNSCFQKWLQLISKESVIRMYTLNYDKLFKVLAEKAGLSVFEGFDYDESIPFNGVHPNISRILSDFDSDIHYNLHGSAFWNVYPRDENSQLLSPFILLHPVPQLDINNNESAVLQMEKGKSILVSNIITGFQKAQKSFITPFKQMQSSFDKDCYFANELFVIGYSFGDSHINASIKTALKYNPELKLHFIDPAYCEKDGKKGYDLLVNRLINIFPEILNNPLTPTYSADRDTCSYYNNKLTVTAISFDEYLNRNYFSV